MKALPVLRTLLGAVLLYSPTIQSPASDNIPRRRWAPEDFGGVLSVGLEGHRSFAKGKALFFSAKCATCHTFASLGSGDAPDLTFPSKHNTPEQVLAPILTAPPHFQNGTAPTDSLTQSQILDLLAFLLSGGDSNASFFFGSS